MAMAAALWYSRDTSFDGEVVDVEQAARTAGKMLRFSAHARRRAARRNIVPDALDYVLMYGRTIQRTGVTFCVLCRRDVPLEDLRKSWAARLVGTVALLAGNGEIITVYRNRSAVRKIARKMKYRVFGVGVYADASGASAYGDWRDERADGEDEVEGAE